MNVESNWEPRLALQEDVSQIVDLILRSSFELQAPHYSKEQISAAMGPVFGVDEQIILDGTYYVVQKGQKIVGCGGWSFRKSLYGGDGGRSLRDEELDPKNDAARIRAFFVDPDYARQGIGSAILNECEETLQKRGFSKVEISATLAGEPLYTTFGYDSVEEYEIPLEGVTPLKVVKMTKVFGKDSNLENTQESI